ncbi:hypothetical protein I302_106243 [Kwoniella bestiolae CBS 10118]|uniref:Uncharacterized protein n=1 Tax=Kwoniella bestiolae CBS 10118 TaxID=1296100 RepID=A0A1B9G3A6_9TREE|nr:hypothetical protein I302_05367 [Kwoniella bestiolae CBS 10118]OCF25547.1 hypothetical protein I302_05367 [Kwoniella bestiolae CBS 10118]
MFAGALLAILPALGLVSASAVPRAVSGKLSPASNTNLCVTASSATAGASVGFVQCGSNPSLEVFLIPSASVWATSQVALESNPSLCLDGGSRPEVGNTVTLATCGTNSNGQMLSKSEVGLISFQNANCLHKKSDTKLDIQTCYTMDEPLKFVVA